MVVWSLVTDHLLGYALSRVIVVAFCLDFVVVAFDMGR
jgi:hypothetical protein